MRHHVAQPIKHHNQITAHCNDCGASIESNGIDRSSREAVANWINDHESQTGPTS